MNRLILLTLLLFSLTTLQAQEEKKEKFIKFSGFITYEAFYDSHASYTTRDDDVYLYPKQAVYNSKGEDINAYGQLNMLSAQSRIRAKINGPEAFGAKVSGVMEFDFLGKAGVTQGGDKLDLTQTPRIRLMFMNLAWEKSSLILGQYWHPVFVTECYPEVISMGASAPFNPLNRAPQVRYTYKITPKVEIVGAALSHLDMYSSGESTAQKKAITPDFHGQLKYKGDKLSFGLVGGYSFLKPRIYLPADSSLTDKTINSYDIQGFIAYKKGNFKAKALAIYGQNLSHYVMIGGYGAKQDPSIVADYDYVNVNSMAAWGELMYTKNSFETGVFVGYSKNIDVKGDTFYDIKATRSGNVDNIFRISPRVAYTMGSVQLGLEYMYATATYVDLQQGAFLTTNTYDPVANHRMFFSATYSF